MLEASARGNFPQALGRINGFAAVELLDSVRPLPVIYRRDVTRTSDPLDISTRQPYNLHANYDRALQKLANPQRNQPAPDTHDKSRPASLDR